MSSGQTVFIGCIGINDGFKSPEPIPGLPGWTVYKSEQTEIYEVIHNLGLTNPNEQLHVFIHTFNPDTHSEIQSAGNSFTISTWLNDSGGATGSDLTFTAVYNPDQSTAAPAPPTGLGITGE